MSTLDPLVRNDRVFTMRMLFPTLKKLPSVLLTALVVFVAGCGPKPGSDSSQRTDSAAQANASEAAVDLTQDQVATLKIGTVGTYRFLIEEEALGNVAYDKTTDPAAKPLVASVTENQIPLVQLGQPVSAAIQAYPGRMFAGKVTSLGGSVFDSGGNPAVDPNLHRVVVRCEMEDPGNDLYPGMLASVAIQVHDPVESIAIPMKGVVRNGDGTMAAWTTTDRRHFVQRIIHVGLQRDDQYQVLDGLTLGEQVVTDGAVFLSNILQAPPTD